MSNVEDGERMQLNTGEMRDLFGSLQPLIIIGLNPESLELQALSDAHIADYLTDEEHQRLADFLIDVTTLFVNIAAARCDGEQDSDDAVE